MTKFLITIPTYNRNEMVNDTIRSIFEQTYSNWEILVSDNASSQPVSQTIPLEYQEDPRFHLIRHDTLRHGVAHSELILQHSLNYDYDFLAILADDDLLLPYALSTIAQHGQNYGTISTSFWYYNPQDKLLSFDDNRNQVNYNTLVPFPGRRFFGYFMKSTGIYLKDPTLQNQTRPPIGETHISSHFFKKTIIEKSLQQYGHISVEPFGDIGFFRLGLEAGDNLYINRPLAIIRRHQSYGAASSIRSTASRFLLSTHHNVNFKYSPVKAITYQNCTLESCLAIVNEMGFQYDKQISATFFIRHLREILRDNPWTKVTLNDILETLPFLLAQLPQVVIKILSYTYSHSIVASPLPILISNVQTIWDAIPICESYSNQF